MTVKELKEYLNLIKDDSIIVRMCLGYNKGNIHTLDATLKNEPKCVININSKEIITDKYKENTLYLIGEVYEKDYAECKKQSVLTIARLNYDTVLQNESLSKLREECEYYKNKLTLIEKILNSYDEWEECTELTKK